MKKFYVAFIAITLIIFAIPAILMFAGYKNENRENRPLALKPKLLKGDSVNADFTADFDKYINENLAFRQQLITAYNSVGTALLNDYSGNKAIVGKDGMLYFNDTVNDYLGVEQLTDEQISSIANYLLDMKRQLNENGIELVFITAPNKASIYPEYMPGYLKRVSTNTNIDMLNLAMQSRGVGYIDAKSILVDAKGNQMVYYKHDSHWNNYGAALIYNAVAERFGLYVCDINAYTSVHDRMGDLHSFVYPATSCNEERFIYKLGDYTSNRPINMNRDNRIETTSDANAISAYIWHDSFGESLQQFFSPAFGRLIMERKTPSSNQAGKHNNVYSIDEVINNGADILIIELVERNLDLLYMHAHNNGY